MAAWQPPNSFRTRPVAVIGGGVLGRRIAACFVAGGWQVHIHDPSAPQLTAALDYIRSDLGTYTALTRRTPGSAHPFPTLPEAVRDAWLVIEAVPERLDLKTSVFRDLELHAAADSVLGSNSSSFKSSQMLGGVGPGTRTRILNTHFMMPPTARVVELMTDGHTAEGVFPFLADRLREAGLHPVVALRESTGFVFNRVWAAIKRETLKVIQEGVSTPEGVDDVFMEMYGAKQGPCRMMDAVGLDTVSFVEKHYVEERGLDSSHLDWLNEHFVQAGKLGEKTPDKGGLYSPSAPGRSTRLIFLDLGVAEPLDDQLSFEEVLQRGRIRSLDVDSSATVAHEILAHEAMPDGVDVFEDRLYWTDMGDPSKNDGAVFSAKLDGSDIKAVVPRGHVRTPKQLVCVPEQRKIYWCDREGCRVMRCNLDGSELEVLVQNGDPHTGTSDERQWCVGITVSTKLGKVFWTQKGPSKGSQGRILNAGLDTPQDPANRNDIEVVLDHLPEPVDLELDDDAGVLYWTDRGELPLGNTLNKKTLAGAQPAAEQKLGRQILAQGFGEAIGLKLDKVHDCIYVTDLGGHIWKCDPHRPAFKKKVFESQTGAFTGLAIVRV